VQLEFAEFVDNGMTGVVAGRITRDDVGFLREKVDDSTLPLITPLAADNYCD
jgi:hypothetical protein